ncbi:MULTISPECIES: ABC transporter permease [Mesorhizobium]|uniref:ABC transporter permease n=1 Tax=Rhizobium loti TaxID=381 RepID=A0A6M7U6B3_RHILI|nr:MULTISPECIES: ABC transporter permease [Mesorhizobium]KRB20072.1 ABC transporter permease [Mesorhizobium sp. Root172]OBQ72783.1 ABC transporter permease [Mesorhizobium loti]QKC71603.1 ABC transporter permease [Mesorhizobium loti]QKC90519.1 ABC transporter permease [Mesorhizobium sp. NZP2234]
MSATTVHAQADVSDQTSATGKSAGRRFATLVVRLGAIAAFAAIMAYFVVFAPGFTSTFNLINVVEQSAILGVLAYGMTSVIIGGGSDVTEGGIDLSIAANMGLCAAVYATLLSMGYGDVLSALAAIAVGMAVGALNALAVVGLGILPLLATLAVLNVAAGMELTLTQNTVVGASSPLLGFLVSGAFLGISALAWALILFSALVIAIFHYTSFGLRLYAVGGHPEAARAAGLSVPFYVSFTYVLSGFCAAVASVLTVSRLSASTPGSGELLLSVLAAALLGTVFSRRFVPTMGGTLLSVLFIGLLANGFQLLNVSSYWVNGVQGALILLVVAITSFARGSEGSR